MALEPLRCFPATLRTRDGRECVAREIKTTWCRRCKEGTRTVYVSLDGRGWPLCLRCARRIEAKPCYVCGDTTPAESRSWAYKPGDDGGRIVIRHESGAKCYPPDIREKYSLPCSNCSAPLRFTVHANDGRRPPCGTTDELACACGARWKLESTALPWMSVYLVA